MYIAPNSTIILLSGVPLDNTYTDTIYFADANTQYQHFSSVYTSKTFNNQTYQRLQRGKMRLEIKADDIYNFNYLMYRNTNYGSKWFYAFIVSVEYINDVTSEITFEIDVIQTWLFDFQLEPSFVEREHSATDEIGENIAAEPIDLGPLVCRATSIPSYFDNYSIVLAYIDDEVT